MRRAARGAAPRTRRRVAVLALTMAILSLARPGAAQIGAPGPVRFDPALADDAPRLRGDFVVAPIPFSNPTIESGLGLAAAYLFEADPGSGTSYVGAGAFGSTNDSRGAALGTSLSLSGDAWRLSAVAGAAEVFYDLYFDDRALPIAQSGWLGRVEAQRRIADGVYLGLRLRYLSVDTRVRFSSIGGGLIPDLGAEVTAGLVGPTLEADFRDDDIAPRAGWRLQAAALQSFDEPFEDFGAGDYQSATLLFDHFTPLFSGDALAVRLAACGVTGDAPFFELCSLGGDDGFRGYASGRYLGRRLLSAQAEYRGRFSERWGWVAFGGVSGVADALGDDDVIKPAGGVGLRYRLSRDFGLDFSADIAFGDEGATGYVYLGQAF